MCTLRTIYHNNSLLRCMWNLVARGSGHKFVIANQLGSLWHSGVPLPSPFKFGTKARQPLANNFIRIKSVVYTKESDASLDTLLISMFKETRMLKLHVF